MRLFTPALVAGAMALPLWAGLTRPGHAALGGIPPLQTPAQAGGSTVSEAFPFPVKTKTLANGLRVYVVAYDSPGLVAYYSIVRTGSRNEVEPGKSGFAHFFEHMMLRGTKKYPADKYGEIVTRMGADSNAYTSTDMTVYE
ncbi:MAG TPA: insulinase family protein, partial [Polyangia bacterium]|nr:insulinase family protein [Polyangia bacterium]